MKFFGRKKEPAMLFTIKERCGVLISTSEKGYLWIISPFWDVTDPVVLNVPDLKIDAIIILNNSIEGCLPFTSFLAADKHISTENIYVKNQENPHDWHPKYQHSKAINELIHVKLLPPYLKIGEHTEIHNGPNDFIKINWLNTDTCESIESLIGNNLYHSENPSSERLARKTYQFIGNYDSDKLFETGMYMTNIAIELGEDKLFIAVMPEWIESNPESLIEAFNHMGLEVYSVGKRQELDDA